VKVRRALPTEHAEIGKLMAEVYSALDGFPKEDEQPTYYGMLRNVGYLAEKAGTEILVAVSEEDNMLGAVVFFDDMENYGSGGIATREKNSGGIRLLAVRPEARGKGIGKLLTYACIEKGRQLKRAQLILHTTKAMKNAWTMYEGMGFVRSDDLDFIQGDLGVYGFRMKL
jgi:GNAT superfamily N-acetyltransferase